VHGIAAAGYVTMRVDKSGLGDSQGPPCSEIDFETELAGYRAGLRALKAMPEVDADRVFIFGHSMGGVMAPLLARDDDVRGIAVYGTIAKNFLEYLVENRRRQAPRNGEGPLTTERRQRVYTEFMVRFLIDGRTPGEIWEAYPHLVDAVAHTDETHFFGRHASFFHQLHATPIVEAWSHVDAFVLAIHGEYDWVSARDDHERIAVVVNAAHPGRGRFVGLTGLDHAFTAHESLEASYRSYTEGARTDEPLATLRTWLDACRAEPS
jgi:pimeloyl-ACP methyl ester carboxylesterase